MIRDHISRVEIFTSELATISLREMFLRCIKNSLSERGKMTEKRIIFYQYKNFETFSKVQEF